ncbi:PREDICTED: uncharacterized protein LOC109383015 isoform X3 [Hipposideros armiger]|uniref:Uncharacterized protein LOC109383015 isoform X3 n=1 Tax=Hipposideros armiger TaxID=186990 RepID=A0A8B7RBW4_HIPAR|nr:PREDICTED: uncharacterized protein LOC109383015 isoform X3 [Hipposideros armiger]
MCGSLWENAGTCLSHSGKYLSFRVPACSELSGSTKKPERHTRPLCSGLPFLRSTPCFSAVPPCPLSSVLPTRNPWRPEGAASVPGNSAEQDEEGPGPERTERKPAVVPSHSVEGAGGSCTPPPNPEHRTMGAEFQVQLEGSLRSISSCLSSQPASLTYRFPTWLSPPSAGPTKPICRPDSALRLSVSKFQVPLCCKYFILSPVPSVFLSASVS